LMFRSGLRMEEALKRIEGELEDIPELRVFVEFIRTSQRGIAR
jgi:UDP-N-acetylglucosamine acyltransferase